MLVRPWPRLVALLTMTVGLVLPGIGVAGAHATGPAPATDQNLARLRWCESGDDYSATTRGRYFGAYQFSGPTWRSLGYQGLAHQAPPGVQDEAARRLQARDGWGPWPGCARSLGLR